MTSTNKENSICKILNFTASRQKHRHILCFKKQNTFDCFIYICVENVIPLPFGWPNNGELNDVWIEIRIRIIVNDSMTHVASLIIYIHTLLFFLLGVSI